MALYTTIAKVREILSREDTRLEGNAGSLDDEDIEQSITDAEAEIDSKLAQVYTVPFSPVPPLVEQLTINVAAYLAHLIFRENRELTSDLNPLYLRYQRALEIMAQLANGSAIIPPSSPDPADPPSRGSQVVAMYTRPPLIVPAEFNAYAVPYHDPASPEWWGIE